MHIAYSECVCVTLGIQHVKRMRRIISSSVACLAVPHYFINGSIFGKKLSNIKCVFRFSLQGLSEIFPIIRRLERDIIRYVH